MTARMDAMRIVLMRPAIDEEDEARLAAALAEVEETEARLAMNDSGRMDLIDRAATANARAEAAEAERDKLKAALAPFVDPTRNVNNFDMARAVAALAAPGDRLPCAEHGDFEGVCPICHHEISRRA